MTSAKKVVTPKTRRVWLRLGFTRNEPNRVFLSGRDMYPRFYATRAEAQDTLGGMVKVITTSVQIPLNIPLANDIV